MIGPCLRKPTVVRDEKCYCWMHDPERLTTKALTAKESRLAHYEEQEREFESRYNRERLLELSGISDLSDDDLERIVSAGGIQTLLSWYKTTPLSGKIHIANPDYKRVSLCFTWWQGETINVDDLDKLYLVSCDKCLELYEAELKRLRAL